MCSATTPANVNATGTSGPNAPLARGKDRTARAVHVRWPNGERRARCASVLTMLSTG